MAPELSPMQELKTLLKRALRSWWKRLLYGKWKVVETGWPYGRGFGTYRPRDSTLLDSGIMHLEDAVRLVQQLNRYE